MFNSSNSKFKIKIFSIVLMSLLFAFVGVGGVLKTAHSNESKINSSVEVETEVSATEVLSSVLSFNVQKENSNNEIKPASATATSGETYSESYSAFNVYFRTGYSSETGVTLANCDLYNTSISYGTNIYFGFVDDGNLNTLKSDDGQTVIKGSIRLLPVIWFGEISTTTPMAIIVMNQGYEFLGFKAGPTSNDIKYTCESRDMQSGNQSVSVQTLDPSYTGTFRIYVESELKPYSLDLYYPNKDNALSSYNYGYYTGVITDKSQEFPDSEDDLTDFIEGATLAGWLFDPNNIDEDYIITTTGLTDNVGTLTVTGNGDTLSFTVTGLAPNGCYIVTEAWGEGDFDQDPANPTLKALVNYVYVATLQAYSDAGDQTGESWDEYPYDDIKSTLYGSISTTDATDDENNYETNIKFDNENAMVLKSTENKAFYHNSDYNDFGDKNDNVNGTVDYYVYNYGYYISSYEIKVNNKYLTYNGSYDLTDTESSIAIGYAKGKSFGSLAEYLDLCVFYTRPTITITPVWTPASLNVNGISINFNSVYDLSHLKTNDNIYALKHKDDLVAFNAVWNYAQIDQSKFNSSNENISGNTYSPASYSLELATVETSGIYRVELGVEKADTYQISGRNFNDSATESLNGSYSYSSTDLKYNSGENTYNGVTEFNAGTYPFVDDYITDLKTDIETYEGLIDGGNDDFDILKPVYYTTGTYSTTNIITSANSASLYVYLADNQTPHTMPTFITNYTSTVFWKVGTNVLEAYLYKNNTTVASEKTGLTVKTNWVKTDFGVTLTPHDVYTVYLYYKDCTDYGDMDFDAVTASYYGSQLVLDLTQSALKPNSNVSGWMLDKDRAETEGYTVNTSALSSENKGNITLTKSGVELTLVSSGKNSYNNYYTITSIQGSGKFLQTYDTKSSFGASGALTGEDASIVPIIRAIYNTSNYSISVNNTTNNPDTLYWENSTLGLNDTQKAKLYGIKLGAEGDFKVETDREFSLTVNNENTYKFIDSVNGENGLAFTQSNTDKFDIAYDTTNYLVFNYGHKIAGWYIKYGDSLWLQWNGSKFVVVGEKYNNTISNLSSVNYGKIVDAILSYDPTLSLNYSVVMYPKWEASQVTLNIKDNNGTSHNRTITYSENYNLTFTNFAEPSGQSLFAFDFVDTTAANMIALSGVWNYLGNTEKYAYASGNYSLTLYNIYVDNIYKVNLSGVYKYDRTTGSIKLESTDYEFNNSTISEELFKYNTYNKGDYTYLNYNDYTASKVLMDDYITNGLNVYRTNWEAQTGNYASLTVYEKVFYNTSVGGFDITTQIFTNESTDNWETELDMWIYIAHGQSPSSLPMFENPYTTVIAWEDQSYSYATSGKSAEDVGNAFDSQLKTSSSTWNYKDEGSVNWFASSLFNARLYHENNSSTYSYIESPWYLNSVTADLTLEEIEPNASDLPTNKPVFDGWIFNKDVAIEKYGEANVTQSGNTFTINLGTNAWGQARSLSINVGENFTYNTNVYRINNIGGYGIFEQYETNPIITAKLNGIYDTALYNRDVTNYWHYLEAEGFNHSAYAGAYVSNGTNDDCTATLEIADTQDYKYPFMATDNGSTSTAFYQKDDFAKQDTETGAYLGVVYVVNGSNEPNITKNYYYLYNYGHRITHYKIKLQHTVNGAKYLTKSGATWIISTNSDSKIAIANLTGDNFTSFQGLAEFLDEYNAGKTGTTTVTIIPIWDEVEFTLTYKDSEGESVSNNVTFARTYELTTSSNIPVGQSLFSLAFPTEVGGNEISDNLVAVSGDNPDGLWNYTACRDHYFYNGYYSLRLLPVYVDNIYRINLTGAYKQTKDGTLLLDSANTDYRFNNSTINEDIYTYYNYDPDDYTYLNYNDYTASKVLMDDYIVDLVTYRNNWVNQTSYDDENALKVYNKIFYSATLNTSASDYATETQLKLLATANWEAELDMWIYIANNQALKNLPMFINDYSKIISWEGNTSAYATMGKHTTDFDSEIDATNKIAVGGVWELKSDPTQNWFANSLFKTRLYYEDRNYSSDSTYSYIETDWYLLDKTATIRNEDGTYPENMQLSEDVLPLNKPVFNGWTFNKDVAIEEYGEANVTQNGNIFTITIQENNEWNQKTYINIHIDGTVPYNDHLYYITNISGYGIFEQDPSSPVFKALLGVIYDVTINNTTANYWSGLLTDHVEYSGAYASADINLAPVADTATIKVQNKTDYNYPFMSSITNNSSTAFYTNTNFADLNGENLPTSNMGYYYVFNYGHRLVGWTIKLDNKNLWLTQDVGGNWIITEDGSKLLVKIEDLTSTTFANIAERADLVYAGKDGDLTFTLYPQWEEVNVVVKVDGTEILDGTFADQNGYAFKESVVTVPTGQSLMAYYYNLIASDGETEEQTQERINNSILALSGKWNYRLISHTFYETPDDTAEKFGDVAYTLNVQPVFIDNIYKVKLNNSTKNTDGTYTLKADTNGFVFNETSGVYDITKDYEIFKYDNETFYYGDASTTSTYQYSAYNREPLMDDYIVNFVNMKLTYEEGIDGDNVADFTIFRKVYHKDGTIKEGNNLVLVSNNNDFNIYLANNQLTNDLPVFENPYYNLIFWTNAKTCADNADNRTYAYSTSIFEADEEYKKDLVSGNYLTHTNPIWTLADGNKSVDPDEALNAYYFRITYILNINTVLDEELGRYGYVLLDFEDTVDEYAEFEYATNAKYLVVASKEDPKVMQAYKIDYATDLTLFAIEDYREKIENGTLPKLTQDIVLYAGCNVTMYVRDQSKDATSMASGNFDEMIGYKFKKDLTQAINGDTAKEPLFDSAGLDENYAYKYNSPALDIANKKYAHKSEIDVDVEYAYINYNLGTYITHNASGAFHTHVNNITDSLNRYNPKENPYVVELIVNKPVAVEYVAFAGFTLEEDAFVLYHDASNNHTLLTYDDGSADGSGAGQILNISTSGTWLRENLYSKYQSNYAIYPDGEDKATELGNIGVETQAITFSYGYVTRDYTDYSTLTDKVISARTARIDLALDINSGKALTENVGNYVEQIADTSFKFNDYWWFTEGETVYALLSSEMYFKSYTTLSDSYYTEYPFPLTAQPNKTFELNSTYIAAMVQDYEAGKIIAKNNRDIEILLDIAKYVEKSMYVKGDFCEANNYTQENLKDPNVTTRAISIEYMHLGQVAGTVYNVVVNPNATFNASNGRFVLGTTSSYELVYPTYMGMNVRTNITQMDETYYKEAIIYPEGVETNEYGWTVVKNASAYPEYVKFVAKPLYVEFVYKLEGSVVELEEVIDDYIVETEEYKPATNREHYIDETCNAVTYEVECVNVSYNLSVSINGQPQGETTSSDRVVSLLSEKAYRMSNKDYQNGKIQIVVDIIPKNQTSITIAFELSKNSTATVNDNYGTFNVYGNGILLEENIEKLTTLNIIEDQKVEVELDLNTGYRFTGFKYVNTPNDSVVLDNNKFTLIETFNGNYHNTNGRIYYIMLEKVQVDAKIDSLGANTEYLINGKLETSQTYVEGVVNFSIAKEINTERLDYYYYYIDKATDQKVYLTTDGTETGEDITTVTITSELLENAGSIKQISGKDVYEITFYVKTIYRYSFVLTVEGGEYLQSGYPIIKANGELTTSGKFHDAGTQISVTAYTLESGNYDIIFNEKTQSEFEEETITLTENTTLTMKVVPHKFNVSVNENIYQTLGQVTGNSPVVEVNTVNNLSSTGQRYNEQATLTFVADLKGDRRLSSITIVHAGETIQIALDNVDFTSDESIATLNRTLNATGYKVVMNGNLLSLTYETKGDVEITLDYKAYKMIDSK